MFQWYIFGFLAVVFFIQLLSDRYSWRISLARLSRWLFFITVVFVFSYFVSLVLGQYFLWQNSGPPVSFLVPPYESSFYVIGYIFARFGFYYAISLFVSFLLMFVAKKANSWFGYAFFEKEELYLSGLSIFVLGEGFLWVYYIFSLFIIALAISVYDYLARKETKKLSLYYLWIPVAVLVILIDKLTV